MFAVCSSMCRTRGYCLRFLNVRDRGALRRIDEENVYKAFDGNEAVSIIRQNEAMIQIGFNLWLSSSQRSAINENLETYTFFYASNSSASSSSVTMCSSLAETRVFRCILDDNPYQTSTGVDEAKRELTSHREQGRPILRVWVLEVSPLVSPAAGHR